MVLHLMLVALVGVQKLAAANSNTATRHIQDGMLAITQYMADCLTLRISDVLEYHPMRDAWIQSIGAHDVSILDELSELHLRDFGILIEFAPDEEERQILENNIQVALANNLIDLDDAIDVREVRNLKTANRVLKLAKKKKFEREQEAQQANIQAQAQANQQNQQMAAQMEIEKAQQAEQAKQSTMQFQEAIDRRQLELEVKSKKELMTYEYELNVRLQQATALPSMKDAYMEDRKDSREGFKEQSKQQMQAQKTGQKQFESNGNDSLNRGIGLGSFEPR